MNKKLEKIELLNKQNELSLSRLDKPDKKNLYINYIKGKIKYELLDREIVFPDEGKTYVFQYELHKLKMIRPAAVQ